MSEEPPTHAHHGAIITDEFESDRKRQPCEPCVRQAEMTHVFVRAEMMPLSLDMPQGIIFRGSSDTIHF